MTTIRIDERWTPYFYVYVVKSSETGLIKVGRTRNLGARLSGLTYLMGKHPLTLLCLIPTHDPEIESLILKRLSRECSDGREWFKVRESDLFKEISAVLRDFRYWHEQPVETNGRGVASGMTV